MATDNFDTVIEEPDTGTGRSNEFVLYAQEATIALYPQAQLSGTSAQLQRKDPAGTWVNVTDDNGNVILSDTRTMENVYGIGVYSLNFTARTGTVGASYATKTK